jgi:two-component system chemotaxis response regulator CheY
MLNKRKPRVLLAEDETHARVLMRAVLTGMNCEVVGEATTGHETLALYRELKPDLLLLDINMPRKTGEEVLAEILSTNPDAVVIMLTSVSDLETVEKCLALGAANYVRKDTPISEIKTIIGNTWKTILRTKKQSRIGC